MFVLLRLRITSASASSGRSGGEDQRTPPHAGGFVVEMPPSRFIVRRRSIRSSPCMHACTHARTHARTSQATVAVLCICPHRVYGGKSLKATSAATIRTCIENGTSPIACRSKRASGSKNKIPFRNSPILHHLQFLSLLAH